MTREAKSPWPWCIFHLESEHSLGWKGFLEVSSPISWSGCSEPFPAKIWKPASMEIPESFWVTCLSLPTHILGNIWVCNQWQCALLHVLTAGSRPWAVCFWGQPGSWALIYPVYLVIPFQHNSPFSSLSPSKRCCLCSKYSLHLFHPPTQLLLLWIYSSLFPRWWDALPAWVYTAFS